MAAPIANSVQLPLDTGNTGKLIRTQTRIVGADTVHEHFFIPISRNSILGKYKASTTNLTVPTSATNGTTTGFAWLYNPVGSAVIMRINRFTFNTQFIAVAADLLGGELRVSRNTFTGSNTGTLVTPAKRDSTDPTNVGQFATTSATWSVTLGATITAYQYQTMGSSTAGNGTFNPYVEEFSPDREDDMIILRAGEGISFWHAVAVTTTGRKLYISVAWEELE